MAGLAIRFLFVPLGEILARQKHGPRAIDCGMYCAVRRKPLKERQVSISPWRTAINVNSA